MQKIVRHLKTQIHQTRLEELTSNQSEFKNFNQSEFHLKNIELNENSKSLPECFFEK